MLSDQLRVLRRCYTPDIIASYLVVGYARRRRSLLNNAKPVAAITVAVIISDSVAGSS